MTFLQFLVIVFSGFFSIYYLYLLDERCRKGDVQGARWWLMWAVILSTMMWLNILMVVALK